MGIAKLLPVHAIEAVLNHVLTLDSASADRLQALAGKRLRVRLLELEQAFTLSVFETQVVLSATDTDAVDCSITTRMAVLPELRDTANITRLIKADALDIDGDPMLAQRISQLFLSLNIDWEAHLAARVGDVPAYWLSQVFQRSRAWLKQQHQQQSAWVAETLIEEKRLLVSRTEFEIFSDEIQQLRAALDRIERRIS